MRYLLAILIFALAACAAPQQWAFHKTVTLPAMKIHVMNEHQIAREVLQRGHPQKWKAFIDQDGISIPGIITMNGVIPDDKMLGHEVRHLLREMNPEFADPDKD